MKKLLSLALIGACVGGTLVLNGCANKADYEIGIFQWAPHAALDNATAGFKNRLKELNLSVSFKERNALGENSNAPGIAQSLINADLLLGVATPAAQSLKNALEQEGKTTPLLFTAVTDPVATNLVSSNEIPGGFVTGTNDMNPIEDQIELFKLIDPTIDKIGIIYTSSEENSIIQANIAKETILAQNMTYVEKTVTSTNDIQSTVTALISEGIDGLYVPTDNILASAMGSVYNSCLNSKTVIVAGESGMLNEGGMFTYGVDYTKLGELTANMAYDILVNGKNPGEIAVKGLDEFPLYINKTLCDEMGITVPQSLLDSAIIV